MRRLLRGVLVIIVLSIILGFSVHFSLLRRFAGGEFREGFLDRREYAGIRFITLAEAEDLFARRLQDPESLHFIDSRSREEYGAGHIPGAVAVPLDELKALGKKEIGPELAKRLPFPETQTLVVYCDGGDCRTSLSLAQLIHDTGFSDIRVFTGGWAEWSASRLPEEKSP
jgi:rhodanese-related sulfurtransferase